MHFNPLPRKEGDVAERVQQGIKRNFNPLPRKEGDGFQFGRVAYCDYFNPLPRKEGDELNQEASDDETYFNPLPRKEGDVDLCRTESVLTEISIHSLVKRETAAQNADVVSRKFQSTPS